jgi:hypothetical protein
MATVYIVMHKKHYGARIRGVFSTKEEAEEFIGPPATETKTCPLCKNKTIVENHIDGWRREQLYIEERTIGTGR